MTVRIDEEEAFELDIASSNLPRCAIRSDFHCVTTWSYLGATWEGVRFADFHEAYVRRPDRDGTPLAGAVLIAQDGYRTTLTLEDLLNDDVLLADTLDGQPLTIEHGAPLRLVAPRHYGYKNLKHLKRIDFHTTMPVLKRGVRALPQRHGLRADRRSGRESLVDIRSAGSLRHMWWRGGLLPASYRSKFVGRMITSRMVTPRGRVSM